MKKIHQKKLIAISVHLIIVLSIYCSGTSITMDGERGRWQPRPDYPPDDDKRVEYQIYGSSPEQQIQKAKSLLAYNNFDDALKILNKITSSAVKNKYTDEAFFLKGKIYSNLLNPKKNFELALTSYKLVIDNLPESEFDDKAKQEIENVKKILELQKK